MAITLVTDFSGLVGTQYITDHNSNYTIIKAAIDQLQLALGSSTGAAINVPTGLQEIFDRDGIIGVGSYLPPSTAPSNIMTVAAGAAWVNLIFAASATTNNVDLTAFGDGTLYLNVDGLGLPNVTTTQNAFSLYSFTWTTAGDTITNIVLLVDILFDGDDYNDQLDSAATGLSFTSVADRLEDIELNVDTAGKDYKQNIATTTGLTFGYFGGSVRNDNVITDTAGGTTVLADDDTNFIEVDSSGVVTDNIVGFTTGQIPLYTVVTASGAITSVTDERTFASLGSGAGLTDTQYSFTGNTVAASSTGQFNLTGFDNSVLTYKIQITKSAGAGGGTETFDIRFYGDDAWSAANLLYSVNAIQTGTGRVERATIHLKDLDASAELHMEIDNNDAVNSVDIDVVIDAEQIR
jgi:hypothetical protein